MGTTPILAENAARQSIRSRWAEGCAWLALAALLTVLVPLFLRMPLTPDASFYDTCARLVLDGGVLERDLLFLVPPGMVWAIALVRTFLGTSTEAFRLADLLLVGSSLALLGWWLRGAGLSRARCLGSLVAITAFYLSGTEWIHCQPDLWMLLPALVALHLRRRQLTALLRPEVPVLGAIGWACLEGGLWGAACLFKPFVVVPGTLVWLTSVLLLRARPRGWVRRAGWDATGLLVGGLLLGSVWQLWLLRNGTWGEFWRNFFDYRNTFYQSYVPWNERSAAMFTHLPPWSAFQGPALFVAALALGRAVVRPSVQDGPVALLAALSVGWTIQANFLQSQFDYHLAAALIPTLALVLGAAGLPRVPRAVWRGTMACALLAFVWQPSLVLPRLALWSRSLTGEERAELSNRLALDVSYSSTADWVGLEGVADYLRTQGARDREIVCFSASAIHLYPMLELRPATRFLYPSGYLTLFRERRSQILEELRHSPARFFIVDRLDKPYKQGAIDFPYNEPVVFRTDRYLVHQPRRLNPDVAPP